MSFEFNSYVIVGLEVPKSKLWITSRKRRCQCNVPNIEQCKFCPNCGEAAFENQVEPAIFLEQNEKWHYTSSESVGRYYVVYSTNRERCFLVWTIDKVLNGAHMCENYNIHRIHDTMQKELEPLGLWNDRNFGIWVVEHIES